MTRSEEQKLVIQAQMDPKAFEALYRAFVQDIYRFIYYRTSSKEVTEDLTSQVFLLSFQKLNQFRYRPGARFSSWLYQIARNQVIDYYRKQKTTVKLDEAAVTTAPVLPLNEVQSILELLSEADSELLQLRLWEDQSYSSIAKLLNSNVVAVRARYSRALKKFKKLYTNRYGTPN